MTPGQTALTRISRAASSSASARVSCITAPFVAVYGASFSQATNELIEAMFTIDEPSGMCGMEARQA